MEVDRDISEMFKIISEYIHKVGDAQLMEHGLTFSQARVLLLLSNNGGSMTQKELEMKYLSSHAAIHGIIVRLREKGFVEYAVKDADKRQREVMLTKLGEDSVVSIESSIGGSLLNILSHEDFEDLKRILSQIVAAIKKSG